MLLPQTDNWEYNLVDLGLTSGTLWMDRNVGAEKPEDYGLYFAWGETQGYTANEVGTKKNFDYWGDYKYANGACDKLTKYCTDSSYGNDGFTDNLTELELSDDAAYGYTNGKCKMSTKEQFQELIDETDYTWTTQNDVNGGLFTSKTNGNSIFVPASGRFGDGKNTEIDKETYILANTIHQYEDGSYMNYQCDYLELWGNSIYVNYGSRYYGYTIRGVKV